MGELPYKPKESGVEWASRKGYLARAPDTPEHIEEQRRKRIEAEKKRKERDKKLSEVFDEMNQTHYCTNCRAIVRISYVFCANCGIKLPW
jgi:hypothetical protein